MNNVECPHCDFQPDDSDWYYDNDLYSPDETVIVTCPKCAEKYQVEVYATVNYICEAISKDSEGMNG